MNKEKIKEIFFDLNQKLPNIEKESELIKLRESFSIEVSGTGCSQCKINAAKRKYRVLIDNLIKEDIIN